MYDFLLMINNNLGPISFHPCDKQMELRWLRRDARKNITSQSMQSISVS